MKRTLFTIIAFTIVCLSQLSAGSYCTWDSWFKYPRNNQEFDYGKPVYVRVDAKKYSDFEYMELYVDEYFVRKESQYPYEWCRPNTRGDDKLRRLEPGKHKLKVKIKDKCGEWHEKYCYIYVKECHTPPTAGPCEWDAWFKYPQNNGQYRSGDLVYVRVDPKKYQDIAYMELFVGGRFVRKESKYPFEWGKSSGSDHILRQLRPGIHKIKVRITDKCGNRHEKFCQINVRHLPN